MRFEAGYTGDGFTHQSDEDFAGQQACERAVEDDRCLSNDCHFGRHGECPDIFANCCDCNCHLGVA